MFDRVAFVFDLKRYRRPSAPLLSCIKENSEATFSRNEKFKKEFEQNVKLKVQVYVKMEIICKISDLP